MTFRENSSEAELANLDNKPALQWLTLEEALVKSKQHPKKILIDVYTDWCGYCKKMDKQVYQNVAVVDKLNRDFYVVKLNAESRQPITINGTTYRFKPEYKAHELAVALLQGELSYPSTVFLNEQQQVMQRVAGYIPPKDFLQGLEYIATQK
ncbi:thioredoxin family protein [Rufibacter roseus]|uniref:Thioredoxin family protein n=2 Tax=Rufibacter roseus TaxID=1567108 RepID=A0ABW2DQ41_9BACT